MSGDKDDDKKDDSKSDDKKAGSGFGSISEFFTHLFTSPFQMIAGLGKGVFSNTILNPIGVLTTGGIIALLGKFAPSLVAWGLDKIGGEKLKARVNEDLKSGARGWIVDWAVRGTRSQAVWRRPGASLVRQRWWRVSACWRSNWSIAMAWVMPARPMHRAPNNLLSCPPGRDRAKPPPFRTKRFKISWLNAESPCRRRNSCVRRRLPTRASGGVSEAKGRRAPSTNRDCHKTFTHIAKTPC